MSKEKAWYYKKKKAAEAKKKFEKTALWCLVWWRWNMESHLLHNIKYWRTEEHLTLKAYTHPSEFIYVLHSHPFYFLLLPWTLHATVTNAENQILNLEHMCGYCNMRHHMTQCISIASKDNTSIIREFPHRLP